MLENHESQVKEILSPHWSISVNNDFKIFNFLDKCAYELSLKCRLSRTETYKFKVVTTEFDYQNKVFNLITYRVNDPDNFSVLFRINYNIDYPLTINSIMNRIESDIDVYTFDEFTNTLSTMLNSDQFKIHVTTELISISTRYSYDVVKEK